MADDVAFLRPGVPVMHKDDFRNAAREQQSGENPLNIDGTSEIQEICVFDEWAYMWTRISIVISTSGNGETARHAGDTLSILRKQNGKWVLFRDANMLAKVSDH